ncbi:MAG: hypothetical protein LIP01_12905 [Tannerellaceae bacterium]|nr:hypothetical protein [Tannerellaceae bacterium]
MKKLVYTWISVLLLISFSGISSCTDEKDSLSPSHVTENTAEIAFLLGIPQSMQITTRGETGTVPENKTDDIYVLVFDKGTQKLIAKSKGKNISVASGAENNNKVTFKATLPVGTEYTFMVLANAANYLSEIEVGLMPEKKKEDVLALVVTETGKWDISSTIPMWSEEDLNLTATSTPSFELTRMLARINVEVNLRDVSPGVPAGNFELTSIRYYNYNTAGALVPDRDKYDFTENAVLTATLPVSPGTQTGSALVYDGGDITGKTFCKEKIYIFEASHNGNADNTEWINNPCLVIGGQFRTSEGVWLDETFYRVDFIKKDNTDPGNVQDIWLSILRNFTYNVVITEVSGSGFPEPEIAVKSVPINMEANILEWNESDMGEIVFDGTFYLSVSRDRFTVGRGEVNNERESNRLDVKTDYIYQNDVNHINSGWYVEKYVDEADGTTPVDWLKLNPEKGVPNDRVKAYFTYEENTTSTSRTAIVWIAADRLRYPVYVTQGVSSIEIVDPAHGDIPLSELKLVVPVGGMQSEQERFKVVWAPAYQAVSIEQTSPKDWAPFEPDWLTPNPSPSWTLTGTGVQEYQVTAPAVSPALIEQDPFYEKESVYTFTVTDGTESHTAAITPHQIYYNLVVDMFTYRLDGNNYNINVRSNAEWIITDIEEWIHNKPPSSTPSTLSMLDLKPSDNLRIGTAGGSDVLGEACTVYGS